MEMILKEFGLSVNIVVIVLLVFMVYYLHNLKNKLSMEYFNIGGQIQRIQKLDRYVPSKWMFL